MQIRIPRLPVLLALALTVPASALLRGADWPDWRGPARTGVSAETGLPDAWSPGGQNVAWKAPYGGRSGPVVFGDRLYLQNTSGSGAEEQERVMCFNADTGKLLWEHRYNMFASDVPAHRLAWSTPIVDGDQLIVSGLTFGWGPTAPPAHRFISFNKANGEILWVSAPEGRPTDTIYANPFVADVDGTRLLISGGSDGAMLAIKIATGEPVWSWLVSKRGLNTAALMVGPDVIV